MTTPRLRRSGPDLVPIGTLHSQRRRHLWRQCSEDMRRKLKQIAMMAASRTCGPLLAKRIADSVSGIGSILLMHRVVARKTDSAACNLTISTGYLESALIWLRDAGVDFVDLPELGARLASGCPSGRRAVALTFDDGYRDNLTLALPILQKYRVPATIFVPSGAPDRDMDVWFLRLEKAVMARSVIRLDHPSLPQSLPSATAAEKTETYRRLTAFIHADMDRRRSLVERLLPRHECSDEALMAERFASWSELREAARDPLLTIGGHTVSHPVLSNLSESAALSEIVVGRNRLAAHLDRPIKILSYPYGGRTECGRREFALAQRAGFDLAVTTRYGTLQPGRTQRFSLPRMTFGGLHENLGALALDVLGQVRPSEPARQPQLSS